MPPRAQLDLRPPADETECRSLAELLRHAFADFGRAPEFVDRFIEHVGRDNLRIVKRGKQVVAGLGLFHFRQWFGGQSVASPGVTCVAVRAEERGSGVGTRMMRALVEELRAKRLPLSVLHPSTVPFYRKAGYEPAGVRLTWTLNLNDLGTDDRSLHVRPMAEQDHDAVCAVHRAYARGNNGNIDRTPREWERIRVLARETTYSYVIEQRGRDAGIKGYVIYFERRSDDIMYDLMVRDQAFLTPAAGRRLLTFLGDHGTIARRVIYEGGDQDPLLSLTRIAHPKLRERAAWMLRVVNSAIALRERGYPAGLDAELHLEIADDVLPDNNGRIVLRIADGAGRVRKGGRGRIRLDVRGLAALYSGYLSAEKLVAAGLAEGGPDDLALASAAFAGPLPWVSDHF